MRVKDLAPDLIHSSRRGLPGETRLNDSTVLDSFSLGVGLALRSELHVEERLWLLLAGGARLDLGGGKGRFKLLDFAPS